jgi:hypothetical protein
MAIVTKLAYGPEQGVTASIVETVSDFYPIRVQLIVELEQLKSLPSADRARAQHRVDHDALLSQVVTYFPGIAFPIRGEPPLAVAASRPTVLGFGMTKYEQGASLVHP